MSTQLKGYEYCYVKPIILNGFKYRALMQIFLFNINHSFADSEVVSSIDL